MQNLDFPLINKKIVVQNFSKAAPNYDIAAKLQLMAASKLCENIAQFIHKDSKILDLGSGTSFIAKNLLKKDANLAITELDLSNEMLISWQDRPKNVTAINGDIENLPFVDDSFDIITSSFSFQWLNNLPKTVQRITKLLKKNGILAFSMPVYGTLEELKICSNTCNIALSTNQFLSFEFVKSAILDAKLVESSFFEEKELVYYKDLLDLFFFIKKTGANYPSHNDSLSKSKLIELYKFYLQNFSYSGRIQVTWQIGYFVGHL